MRAFIHAERQISLSLSDMRVKCGAQEAAKW